MSLKRITFAESVEMIATIINNIFNIDEGTGRATAYFPENYDYAFRLAVAHYYCGYEITGDINKDYDAAMDVDISLLQIDAEQIRGIENAVIEKIEMKKAEINKTNIIVVSQLDDVLESLAPMLEKLGNTIEDKISKIDVSELNEKLKDMNMSELVKLYMESSFADQNRNSVIDAKNKKIVSLQNRLNAISGRNAFADKK